MDLTLLHKKYFRVTPVQKVADILDTEKQAACACNILSDLRFQWRNAIQKNDWRTKTETECKVRIAVSQSWFPFLDQILLFIAYLTHFKEVQENKSRVGNT